MNDPNPTSRTSKQKGGKAAMKEPMKFRFFNKFNFIWNERGWNQQYDDEHPFLMSILGFPGNVQSHYRMHIGDFHPDIDPWFARTDYLRDRANEARFYRHDLFFFLYWMDRLVTEQELAIYHGVWKRTMKASEGTERSHPYGQRIEQADAKRIAAADKAAEAAALEWTKDFL